MYSEEAKQRLGHVADAEWTRITVDPSVGCRYAAYNCPVFHALHNAGLPVNGVDGSYVHWLGAGRLASKLPPGARHFVQRFDHGWEITPMPIELLVNRRTLEIKDA